MLPFAILLHVLSAALYLTRINLASAAQPVALSLGLKLSGNMGMSSSCSMRYSIDRMTASCEPKHHTMQHML